MALGISQRVSQRKAPGIFLSVERADGDVKDLEVTSDVVLSLRFLDSDKKADKLSLTINNFENRFWDEETFRKGNKLHFVFGYPGMLSPRRIFIIKKATGGRVMTVEAKSLSTLLFQDKVVRTFENMTRSDVVRTIARERGYTGEALHIEDTTELIDIINQPAITEASFLKRLARREGFEFFIDWDGFHWHQRRFDQAPARRVVWYNGALEDENSIIDYNIDNDLTAKPAKIRKVGRDPDKKEEIDAEGSDSETERDVLSDGLEIVGDDDEFTLVTRRIVSTEVSPTAEDTQQKAKTRADGRFRKIQQTAVKMTLQMLGDPRMFAKVVLLVDGLGTRLSGRYYVKEIDHQIGSGGYTMSVKLITDGSGGHKGVSTADALAPQKRERRESGSTLATTLRNAAQTIRDRQANGAFFNEGTEVLERARRAEEIAQLLEQDPNNRETLAQAREESRNIRKLGERRRDNATERAGKAAGTATEAHTKELNKAQSKKKKNNRPIPGTEDGKKALQELGFDSESGEPTTVFVYNARGERIEKPS